MAALGAQSFTYNANDEISGDTFDANGNTTASSGYTFAYDFENRLVSKDGGAVTLQYNCDGDRVAKTAGGVTTRYLVDDLNPTGYLQVLEEVVGGAVQTRYTYGTSIVSQTRSASSTPATSYYGYDGHGNITFLTDAAGAVTDSYDYEAWGNVVVQTGSTSNSRFYAGEELDPDVGLINLRARQYRLDAGRFLTLDLIAGRLLDVPSLNRYLYAQADPTNRVDPLGLADAAEETFLNRIAAALQAPANFVGPTGGIITTRETKGGGRNDRDLATALQRRPSPFESRLFDTERGQREAGGDNNPERRGCSLAITGPKNQAHVKTTIPRSNLAAG